MAAAAILIATAVLAQAPAADPPLPSLDTVIHAAASTSAIPQDLKHPVEGLVFWIARTTSIPVGLEIDADLPDPGVLTPADLDTFTIRAALDAIVRAEPNYDWKDIGGIPVVRPRAAWRDPRSPLNRPLSVRWTNEHPALILERISELLYGYRADEAVDDSFDARRLTIDVPAGSLIDVLNAMVRHGNLWWSVTRGGQSGPSFTMSLGHIQWGGGIARSFPDQPTAR